MERKRKRPRDSEEFKEKVAVEAVKGVRTLSELNSAFGVHPTVIAHWKRPLLEGAPAIFSAGRGTNGRREEEITSPLYDEGTSPLVWTISELE